MLIPTGIEFKSKNLIDEYQMIRRRLQIILEDMARFCLQNGVKFIVTDLMSEEKEDKKLKRVSKSHSEGRAADIRVRDWDIDFFNKFKKYFEAKYVDWAALSKGSFVPTLIVKHDNGNGIHTHIQIRPYKES